MRGACSICGVDWLGSHTCTTGTEPTPTQTEHKSLADLFGLTDEQKAEMQAEYEKALAVIEESERQAALNSHKVWLR